MVVTIHRNVDSIQFQSNAIQKIQDQLAPIYFLIFVLQHHTLLNEKLVVEQDKKHRGTRQL